MPFTFQLLITPSTRPGSWHTNGQPPPARPGWRYLGNDVDIYQVLLDSLSILYPPIAAAYCGFRAQYCQKPYCPSLSLSSSSSPPLVF